LIHNIAPQDERKLVLAATDDHDLAVVRSRDLYCRLDAAPREQLLGKGVADDRVECLDADRLDALALRLLLGLADEIFVGLGMLLCGELARDGLIERVRQLMMRTTTSW
jgi:hypothetical protein